MNVIVGQFECQYHFFEQDWRDDEEWSSVYDFPRSDKEFKRMIEQVDRGDGIRVVYSDTRVRSPLWGNVQKRPYIGVRRKGWGTAVPQ